MGFSCRREPRVGLFHSLANGVSLFSTFTCPPQSRICLTISRNGFSTVRSQIVQWVILTDLCCSGPFLTGRRKPKQHETKSWYHLDTYI